MAKSEIGYWVIVALRLEFIILGFEKALSTSVLVTGMVKKTCYSLYKFGKTLQSLDLCRNSKICFALLH